MAPHCTEKRSDSPALKGSFTAGRTSCWPGWGSETEAVMSLESAALAGVSAAECRAGQASARAHSASHPAARRAGGAPAVRLQSEPQDIVHEHSGKFGAGPPAEYRGRTMSSMQPGVKHVLAPSDRLENLPAYTLAKVFQDRDAKVRQGADVIDLGVGNPDLRPPQHAIDALKAALDDTTVENHRYPSFAGLPEFRAAVASFYKARFGVSIDPATEALALVGSKEGIAKFMSAHLNPGDTLLLATPCYPAYLGAAALTQARVVEVPLLAKNGFRPDLSAIATDDARRAKIISVNFPNNPTGGVETPEFYTELLHFAREYDLFVLSDIAYCDLSMDPSYRARSFLEFDRDKERTVEFHSFSKS